MKTTRYPIILLLLLATVSLQAQWNPYTTDTITFEGQTPQIIIDTLSNNIWQIGTPNKTLFDSAYAGTKAIVTDTVNSYPINDTSSFILVIDSRYTYTCYTKLEFWHKFNTDTLTDIGFIDVSYDAGNSWLPLTDTSLSNWNGTFFQWEAGSDTISGKSDGWQHAAFRWHWWIAEKNDTIIIEPDTLLVRFNFISDSIQTNKDGWIIDNIVLYRWNDCSDIQENDKKILFYPNPLTDFATLQTDIPLNNATITIYNTLGQTAMQIKNCNGTSFQISRNNLQAGLYLLVVREKDKILTKEKIIIR